MSRVKSSGCLVVVATLKQSKRRSNNIQVSFILFYLFSPLSASKLSCCCGVLTGWANARTENGEGCLHLAGIYGHSQVTELLLKKGADPNTRSIWEQGLRMHPLSWNVYGGHIDNVRLLLENGADANLDFDSMTEDKIPVTAMDIVLELQKVEEGDDRFAKLDELLRKYGAMTVKELEDKKNNEL